MTYKYDKICCFTWLSGDGAVIGGYNGLYLFDTRTGKRIRGFHGHTGVIWAAAPSPSGALLLSASDDQTLRIWNLDHEDPPHGALVYRYLKERSPAALAKVVDLLKKHPDHADRFHDKVNAEKVQDDERDLCLFMLAAQWADEVRKTKADRPKWHYVNYPLTFPPGSTPTKEPDGESILRALSTNLETLKGTADDAEKAIALDLVVSPGRRPAPALAHGRPVQHELPERRQGRKLVDGACEVAQQADQAAPDMG